MYQPPHASMSRVLNNEAKEAGYARQLKRGAKKVEEILQEIEQLKSKITLVETQTARTTEELKQADEVSKL